MLVNRFRLPLFLLLAATLLNTSLASPHTSQAQPSQPVSRTFSQTGKTVSGKFLEYWLIHGGLPQQGFPISNELSEISDTDGRAYTVQYFERAVFEYHPDLPLANRFQLAALGRERLGAKYSNGVEPSKQTRVSLLPTIWGDSSPPARQP